MSNDERYYIIETDGQGIACMSQTTHKDLVDKIGRLNKGIKRATLLDHIPENSCTSTWGTEMEPGILIIRGRIVDPSDLKEDDDEE